MTPRSAPPGEATTHSLGDLPGRPTGPRAFTLLAGLTIIATFLGVFYRLVDVVGGVPWLLPIVAGALMLSIVFARFLPPRVALGVGATMLLGEAVLYVVLVPEHHDRVLTVGFLVDFAAYLTDVSVLQFLRVDLWALSVVPGPPS